MSFEVKAPTGKFYEDKLINIGANRWAFKAQYGISHHVSKWYLEAAANIWLYTSNNSFWNGNTMKQKPLGVAKAHLIRTFDKKMWAALGFAYAIGGTSYVNGERRDSQISTFRVGAIVSLPIHKRHSVKLIAVSGRRFNKGADFDAISMAYQYMWN